MTAFNRYMYVEGNPVNHNDPSGHWPGKGFWNKIIEKSVKTAVQSGVTIVKKIPEGLQKVQSGIASVTGNMVKDLRKVPVKLAGIANDIVEGFETIKNNTLGAALKAAHYLYRTGNSMLMGAAALYNNTIFNGDWWECQWNGWLRETLFMIATIVIIAGAFYLGGPVAGCFAIVGALAGGTKGHPFNIDAYKDFNWGYSTIGALIGAIMGMTMSEGVLTGDYKSYSIFGFIFGPQVGGVIDVISTFYTFLDCYHKAVIDGDEWEPLPVMVYKKLENANFEFSAYGGSSFDPSYY